AVDAEARQQSADQVRKTREGGCVDGFGIAESGEVRGDDETMFRERRHDVAKGRRGRGKAVEEKERGIPAVSRQTGCQPNTIDIDSNERRFSHSTPFLVGAGLERPVGRKYVTAGCQARMGR